MTIAIMIPRLHAVLQQLLYAELQQSSQCANATNLALMLEAAEAVECC